MSKNGRFPKRVCYVAANPDEMTEDEIMSSEFLDLVFWKKFDKGEHTLHSRRFTIVKNLWDGTYYSNSRKTRYGRFIAYFEVTNNQTGEMVEVGIEEVNRAREWLREHPPNRSNDPKRNYGLGRE
tara:strand:- start:67 stop:441 length:375 start_codon:yes stop_codon:yes gene_type:complete